MEQSAETPRQDGGPFRSVIVGFDDEQGGWDAAALATDLVATDGSVTLVLVHVRDLLVGRTSATDPQVLTRTRAIEPKSPASLGAGRLVHIDSTSVGRGLHERADSEHADLLVVGSCRRGLLGRVMIGDDTSDALNAAPCAVAIAPLGYAEQSTAPSEIGVAYNGSADSEHALAVARALAVQHGAKVSACETVTVPSYVAFPGAGAVPEDLPGLVDQAKARIAALGDVEPHAGYGVPAEELALYSASLGLLIVGSRGYGPLGRLVHGSTSRHLARTARCPLLILTRHAPVLPERGPHHFAAHVATAVA